MSAEKKRSISPENNSPETFHSRTGNIAFITCMEMICLVLLAFSLYSCATTKETLPPDLPAPAWFPEPQAAYPKAEYIVQLAEGESDKEAQSLAMQAVTRYISTTVESEMNAVRINDSFSWSNQIKLTTNIDLFGLQCSEAWWCKDTGKWYAVGFINRKEAWDQYVPVIEQQRRSFRVPYDKAEAEPEPLFADRYYREALEEAPAFLETLVMGRLISPEFEKQYDTDRDAIASIPVKLQEAYSNAKVCISVSNDLDRKVESCLADIFTDLHFSVCRERTCTSYVLTADIEDNLTPDEDMVYSYPSLRLTLTNCNDQTIFTYSCSLGKNAAYTQERLRQRTIQSLTADLTEHVAAEFRQKYPEAQ